MGEKSLFFREINNRDNALENPIQKNEEKGQYCARTYTKYAINQNLSYKKTIQIFWSTEHDGREKRKQKKNFFFLESIIITLAPLLNSYFLSDFQTFCIS